MRIVCTRRTNAQTNTNDSVYAQPTTTQFFQSSDPSGAASYGGLGAPVSPTLDQDRLVKAKSEQDLLTSSNNLPMESALNRIKSRSLEPMALFAMWSSEPTVIELIKGDRGLGFSILDYQVQL